jgi:hypothetical protein
MVLLQPTRKGGDVKERGANNRQAQDICIAKYGVGWQFIHPRTEISLGLFSPAADRPVRVDVEARMNRWLARSRPFMCARTFLALDRVELVAAEKELDTVATHPQWVRGVCDGRESD